jgi:membrane protein insertase Oxa1/YidC/SpoIIIJ
MDLGHLFTLIIYQPFLNILVGIYWVLGLASHVGNAVTNAPAADMGVAVIIFTIIVRIILLPLTLAGERSEKERREIEEKIQEIERRFEGSPIQMEREIKLVLKSSRRMVFSSLFELCIQVIIALMLWRIFSKGLLGEDLHLIYTWMPKVQTPFNLKFLGEYDLTHAHMSLNLLQSILIFVLETIHSIASPYKVTRRDVVRMQFTLPIFSFMIFAFLPAGKKLFVITALSFSIVYATVRLIYVTLNRVFSPKPEPALVPTQPLDSVANGATNPPDHQPPTQPSTSH